MKTTTIGRIGAVVAGAAMLGTAVASAFAGAAVDANLTKGFFFDANMNPQVQMVVGEKAMASDGAAAGQIAAMIGNMAYTTETKTIGGTEKTVSGGTATCTPSAAECAKGGVAKGTVILSYEAAGMIGELQQKAMDCEIYTSSGMEMNNLTDGGDSGSWCSDNEVFTYKTNVGTTLVGACATVSGADVGLLKDGEFANEICTICYNYCDIALGCEPHRMYEWINLSCDKVGVTYDCDDEKLEFDIKDGAIVYNVFTDDILSGDVENDETNPKLVGQSYLGKIILGQQEYYVEDLKDDKITIVCGATGTATTSASMEYTTPAEGGVNGVACAPAVGADAQTYSIKLVGAQTIEEKGVVDVTLEVTKPDGTVEQVTSGMSGTPVVGDVKVKLQRGTAASNVITGEQSFSAEILVWYVPSEYVFEDDEQYDEMGRDTEDMDDDDVRAEYSIAFNGGEPLDITDLCFPSGDNLEDKEILYNGSTSLGDLDIKENKQCTDCYDEANTNDLDTAVLRFLEFTLQNVDEDLAEGDYLSLPFNDGKYLLSDIKFGYAGLFDDNFVSYANQDKVEMTFEISDIDIWNATESESYSWRSKLTVKYKDKYDETITARMDQGPFLTTNEIVMIENIPVKIRKLQWDSDLGNWVLKYRAKDGSSWDDSDTLVNIAGTSTAALVVDAQVINANATANYANTSTTIAGKAVDLYVVNTTDSDDKELYIMSDGSTEALLATTANQDVQTQFKDKVVFSATGNIITVDGASTAGAANAVTINFYEHYGNASACIPGAVQTECSLENNSNVSVSCSLSGDCAKISTGKDDGKLISLSGAMIDVEGDEDVEVNSEQEYPQASDAITKVVMTVPEKKVRPTLFLGLDSSVNSSTVIITEELVETIVSIGGVEVLVEEFGIEAIIAGVEVIGGEPVTVACDPVTVACDTETLEVGTPVNIGYKLVVVEGQQNSAKNLVLVGGPAVNSLTKDLVTVDDLCKGASQVKLYGNKLLVAGCSASDTAAAATELEAWISANL